MSLSALKKNENELTILKQQISQLSEKLNQRPVSTKVEVTHYLGKLEALEQQFKELVIKFTLCTKTDEEATRIHTELGGLEQLLDDHILEVKIKGEELRMTSLPNPDMHRLVPSQRTVKLPTVNLSNFSGRPQDWMEFHDSFKTTIHDDSSLADVTKFKYLRSCIEGGSAREIIHGITTTDDNYEIAWNALKSRYENKRELYYQVMQSFISLPVATVDNASSIRSLIDGTNKCIRTINNLSIENEWEAFLVFSISKKMDSNTRQLWEQTLSDTEIPGLDMLLKFLETRARSVNVISKVQRTSNPPHHIPNQHRFMDRNQNRPHHPIITPKVHATQSPVNEKKCIICSGHHSIFKCEEFKAIPVEKRGDKIKSLRRCLNCFGEGHHSRSCPSANTCQTCNLFHHSLLHIENFKPLKKITTHTTSNPEQTMLATALVQVNHNTILSKALLDGGSTDTIISSKLANRLGLQVQQTDSDVYGAGESKLPKPKGTVCISIQPRPGIKGRKSYHATALVFDKITCNLPQTNLNIEEWSHLKGLQLADPCFEKSSEVELLIGGDVFWDILIGTRIKGPPGSPIAVSSEFGWLVAGAIESKKRTIAIVNHLVKPSLDTTLEKFWELETVPEEKILTQNEEQALTQFNSSVRRNESGRYVVSIPKKNPTPEIGSTLNIATRRFLQLEKRLEAKPTERKLYNEFMETYQNLNHMREFTPQEYQQANSHHYIPHHAVFKDPNVPEKFRTVFDASARTENGLSINDTQLVGPTIQNFLHETLLNFRIHKYVFTADVSKMYRQILVEPEDQKYQCILWRSKPKEMMKKYKLLTVTYGTASAPFLAQMVLKQLSIDERANLPIGAEIIARDMYMDDLMSGSPTITDAQEAVKQLDLITKACCMKFTKWTSNHPDVLQLIPVEEKETTKSLLLQDDGIVKTLGLHWDTKKDSFTYKAKLDPLMPKLTKCIVASQVAKTFDPLGWLAPVIVRGKIFLQDLWKITKTWDEILPEKVQEKWNEHYQSLSYIEDIQIPRNVFPSQEIPLELHGFCDASEKAYAAAVYVRFKLPNEAKYQMHLLTSKTKVAPTKTITLPRLELCSAHLLSKLISSINLLPSIKFQRTRAWTDSTISLAWIQGHPSKWKTFIGNRVCQIQSKLPADLWNHIPGEENPADCASRGISAEELVNHPLWWTGPPRFAEENFSYEPPPPPTQELLQGESKKLALINITITTVQCELINRYSSLRRLTRITAWCLKFIKNCKSKSAGPPAPAAAVLTVSELDEALTRLIIITQNEEFHTEINQLKNKKPLHKKSKLISLDPFIDSNQILRVGGRLDNAPMSKDRKHPILLPRRSKLTQLIVIQTHLTHLHAGSQLTLTILTQKYWIIRGRDLIRFLIRKCHRCVRHGGRPMTQMMGNLPAVRVTPARPFLECGVDFAGPFNTKPMLPRSTTTLKSYLALFVCMTTRAVHLELVSSLSADAFLATLRRFTSRRGKPKTMYSDCGTNFVGANHNLEQIQEFLITLSKDKPFINKLSNEQLTWRFNPPAAPHWGGIWEAGVKSTKFHLYRVIGDTRLTFEEMTTFLTQVEATLNSRPLTVLSCDPNDLMALTPAHFLIGDSLHSIPEEDLTDVPTNRLNRWNHIQQMTQHFWKRWSQEYLHNLQQRTKWRNREPNLKPNDVVLIKDDNSPPSQWPLALVTDVNPGPDGLIRSAKLRTADSAFHRPISKLILLPTNDESINSSNSHEQDPIPVPLP